MQRCAPGGRPANAADSCRLERRPPPVPISSVKTDAPLVEPSRDDGRVRRSSMPGRPHVLKAGTVLQNRYRVIKVLGVGGMSTAYRSRDLRFT